MYDALAVRVLYSDHRPWYTTALHSQSFYNHSTANAISKFVTLSFKRFTKGWRSSSVQCRNLNRIKNFILRGKGDLVTLKRFRPVRIHWITLVCNKLKNWFFRALLASPLRIILGAREGQQIQRSEFSLSSGGHKHNDRFLGRMFYDGLIGRFSHGYQTRCCMSDVKTLKQKSNILKFKCNKNGVKRMFWPFIFAIAQAFGHQQDNKPFFRL